MSNRQIAQLLKISPGSIANSISRLSKQEYIKVVLDERTRQRKELIPLIVYGKRVSLSNERVSLNNEGGVSLNNEYNNINKNNKNNNITKKNIKRYPKDDYNLVLDAYQKYKGIKLAGSEFVIPLKAIKLMFEAKRTPEEIISFMKWLSENQNEIPWTRTWTIWTVRNKLPEFLAGKLEVSDGDDSIPL